MLSTLAQRTLKVTAAAVDHVRRPVRGVVILLYHRVGGRSSLSVDLPTALFDEQMSALAAGAGVVTLDDAIEILTAGAAPEADPVVVTFDDGTADFVDEALPILERYRIPATVYVATDFVDRGRPFPHAGMPLSWEALGDAIDTGLVTVGSHTHTHVLLDRVAAPEAEAELDRSTELIGEQLGVPARHFAYPKAAPGSAAADAAVRKRFRSAALAGNRPNPYGRTDPHRLARSPIQTTDGMRFFRRKIAGGMEFEERVRQVMNRRRYAGATT